jgi:hypothetical protein
MKDADAQTTAAQTVVVEMAYLEAETIVVAFG